MNRLKQAAYVLRYLGPRFIWQRVGVALHRKSGKTRRIFAAREWENIRLAEICQAGTPGDAAGYRQFKEAQPARFFFPMGLPPAPPTHSRSEALAQLSARIDLLREDRCTYCFHTPANTPNRWNVNALTGQSAPADADWHAIPDFSPAQGDMRTLWDPARCAWAIDLARAAVAGVLPRENAAALYWRWLDSFLVACPPYRGPQWKCGQESSVRMLSLAIGFWALAGTAAFTDERFVQFARLAWATGYRVAHHIDYAVSQKNNHALSEAGGLMLIAQLFPELRDAAAWRETGRRILMQEMRRQIYSDGSYVQQSTNYHRVMLDVCSVALRLAEVAGEPLDRDVYERLGRSVDFLHQLIDAESGGAPNYGNNDGAWVLPLCDNEFCDYRPAVTTAQFVARRERSTAPGPADEPIRWLFGADAVPKITPVAAGLTAVSSAFGDGGYFTLRAHESWAMIRCHTYRDRPAHSDMLHLDLWWRGQNVAGDAGTFQYYIPEDAALERYFGSIIAHNTVQIDNSEPLERVSRFLRFPWPRARERVFDAGESPRIFEGEHYAYDRSPWHVVCRRTVIALDDDSWFVVDDILGAGQHCATLRWRTMGDATQLDSATALASTKTPRGEFHIAVAAAGGPFDRVALAIGHASAWYAHKSDVRVLEATRTAALPMRFVSTLGPAPTGPPQFRARNDRGECWSFQGPGGQHEIWLARCARETQRTLVRALEASRPTNMTFIPVGSE